jgi:hypothetical protein
MVDDLHPHALELKQVHGRIDGCYDLRRDTAGEYSCERGDESQIV